MADKQQIITDSRPLQLSGKAALLASAAGVIIGGPLIGLMGISFLAAMTLLIVTSPLFILFSPVLFGAACVFAFAMLGFAAAAAMAVVGFSAVAWVLRPFTASRRGGGAGGDQDWSGYIQQKSYHPRENVLINIE